MEDFKVLMVVFVRIYFICHFNCPLCFDGPGRLARPLLLGRHLAPRADIKTSEDIRQQKRPFALARFVFYFIVTDLDHRAWKVARAHAVQA